EDSSDATGRIYDRLEAHFGGDNVFMDIDAIPLGIDFRDYISQQVQQCDVLLAVIGDQWLDACNDRGERRLDDPSDFVRLEIEAALRRDIPVIPVLVGRATMPDENDLPPTLRNLSYRNAAEVRSGRDFRGHVERLIQGINHLFSGRLVVSARGDGTHR